MCLVTTSLPTLALVVWEICLRLFPPSVNHKMIEFVMEEIVTFHPPADLQALFISYKGKAVIFSKLRWNWFSMETWKRPYVIATEGAWRKWVSHMWVISLVSALLKKCILCVTSLWLQTTDASRQLLNVPSLKPLSNQNVWNYQKQYCSFVVGVTVRLIFSLYLCATLDPE